MTEFIHENAIQPVEMELQLPEWDTASQILAALKDCVDVIGLSVYSDLQFARKVLDQIRRLTMKEVVVSEFGVEACSDGEEGQYIRSVNMLRFAEDNGIREVRFCELMDRQASVRFGLFRQDGSPRPVVKMLLEAEKQLPSRGVSGELIFSSHADVHVYGTEPVSSWTFGQACRM